MTLRDFDFSAFLYLVTAARWTVILSLLAFFGGGALGLVIALLRICPVKPLRQAMAGYILVMQGTPALMQLFVVYYGIGLVGIRPDPWVAAAYAFTVSSSAFFAEIWRGCIQAIPRGQWESARSLGLSFTLTVRLVIMPQALRITIAPTIGYMVQIIKGTSLASLIGFTELARAGQVINTMTFEPARVFGSVALIYFVLCWPLSYLSQRYERRIDRARGDARISLA
jgi:polar amino acid transport system permease protein